MPDNAGQGISQGGYLALLWTLTGIATLLLAGRLLARRILVKSFHLDDVFSTLAYILLLAAMIAATLSTPLSYQFSAILVGDSPIPSQAEFADMTITLRRWNFAGQILFFTSLYCVKISFMCLYQYLMSSHGRFMTIWWIAMVYVILTYGVCLIGVFGQCGDARNLWKFQECNTPHVRWVERTLLWVIWFFHVSSDLIVVFLPMPLIWRLHMPRSQRLAVSAVCSLALVTIAFETVRCVKLWQLDSHLTNLYSYTELLVTVIIGMLPSYRFMVGPSDTDREYRRLFWSRVTLRRGSNNSSAHSLSSYGRASRYSVSFRNIRARKDGSEEDNPLPSIPPWVTTATEHDSRLDASVSA